ncbi:MAG: radical SAM protein [Candidatus Hydrogenedentota bacterium]
MPFLDFDINNKYFDIKSNSFRIIDKRAYMQWLGLNLNIIWTRGCPNKCAYCYNSTFISQHRDNAKIRYPSPHYIIDEIKSVLKIYPMISWISFIDDGMMAISYEKLREFAELYANEIKLPFLTYGTHPNYITEEKIRLLVKSGSIFFRMGIQNFSEKILQVYNRKTSIELIDKSVEIIAKFREYITPPGYDIILDNFFSTISERREHLEKVYNMPRPFIINLHSLRIFPASLLEINIKNITSENIPKSRDKNLLHLRMTVFNISHYLLSIIKPAKRIFNLILKYGCDDIKEYNLLGTFMRFLFLIRRGLGNIYRMDFSFISGNLSYILYFLKKAGILKLYNEYTFYKLKNEKKLI